MTKGFDDFMTHVGKPVAAAAKNPKPRPKPKPSNGYFVTSGFNPLGVKPVQKPVAQFGTGITPRPKPSSNPSPARSTVTRPMPRVSSGSPAKSVPVAPKAPSRPKTFTDASGKVRPVAPLGSKKLTVTRSGVKKTSAPTTAPVDPLESMVDKIIAGMNAPLAAQQTDAADQARGTIDENRRLNNTYQDRIGGLKASSDTDLANAMTKAAELKGLSADTISKNHDWLMSLMGPDVGGGGYAQAQAYGDRASADIAAQNDDIARGMKNSGQRTADYLTASQASGAGWNREMDYQAGLAQKAQQKQLQDQINTNTGGKAQMLYTMQADNAKQQFNQQVAENAGLLDKAKFDSNNYFKQANLDLATTKAANADKLAQQKLNAPGKPVTPGRYAGLPARFDAVADGIWSDLNKRQNHVDKDGNPASTLHAPWRTAYQALVDHGVPPNNAAYVATSWYAGSITSSDPASILKMLRSRRVSNVTARRIITEQFGPTGWKTAHSKGGLGDAVDGLKSATAHLSSSIR